MLEHIWMFRPNVHTDLDQGVAHCTEPGKNFEEQEEKLEGSFQDLNGREGFCQCKSMLVMLLY